MKFWSRSTWSIMMHLRFSNSTCITLWKVTEFLYEILFNSSKITCRMSFQSMIFSLHNNDKRQLFKMHNLFQLDWKCQSLENVKLKQRWHTFYEFLWRTNHYFAVIYFVKISTVPCGPLQFFYYILVQITLTRLSQEFIPIPKEYFFCPAHIE